MGARKRRRDARTAPSTDGPAGRPIWGEWGLRLAPVLAVIFVLVYLGLFFSVPVHRTVVWMMLVPEQLVEQWSGGAWSRFELSDRLGVMVLATLLQLSSLGYGFLVMGLLGWRVQRLGRELVDWPIAAALGLGVHSVATLLAGCLRLLHWRGLAWVVVLFGAAFAFVAAWQAWQAARPGFLQRAAERGWLGAGALIAGWLALFLILAAILPPFDFDVREYHLQVPKEWYQAGRVTFMSHNVYGNMPLGAEMAALEAMVLWGGEEGWWWGALCGKLMMGGYTLWTALWLVSMGTSRRVAGAGMIAALLYLSTPWVMHVSISGLNDGCLALYYLGVVDCVLRASGVGWGTRAGMRWLRLAGALAGVAAAIKYPALAFLVLPLGCLAVYLLVRRLVPVRVVVTTAIVACAMGGGWYFKNAMVSGNPVYPLAARQLDGRTRTPERIAQWERAHQVPRDLGGRRYSPRLLIAAMHTATYGSPLLAPALFPLALLGVLRGYRAGQTWFLVGVTVLWFGLWFMVTHRIERFWIPFLPVVAWLAAANWRWRWRGYWQCLPVGLAVVGLVYGVFASTTRLCGDNRIFVALDELRDDLPHSADPEMSRTNRLHVWLNRRADFAVGEGVLLVGDAQPFDLERPVYYNTCFDATWLERWMADESTAAGRWQALRERKIRYVLVDWDEIARYRRTYGYSDFVTRELIDVELWRRQRVLRKVTVSVSRDVELFEVVREEPAE